MFNPQVQPIDIDQRLHLLKKHIELYATIWGNQKNFQILKRFFKIYLQEFPGAGRLRGYLMETQDYPEALKLIAEQHKELHAMNHQFQR